jgi:hypothetical protein
MRIARYRKLAHRHRIIVRISKGETADFLDFKSQKNPKIPKSKSIFLPMNDVVSA